MCVQGQRAPDAALIPALMAEHVAVRALLEGAATAIDAGAVLDAAEALRAGRALLLDGLDEHIRAEDEDLFPAIADGLGEQLVSAFTEEHTRIRSLRDQLLAGLATPPAWVDVFRELAYLLGAHTTREDEMLFPAASALLASRDDDR